MILPTYPLLTLLHAHVPSFQIADSQADGEFVYLICQSTKTGKVYTVVDQRDEMENAMRTNRDPSDDLISRFFTKKD